MKTNVSNITDLNNVKLLSIETSGVDNIKKMYILTQIEDISIFNSDNYFDEDCVLTGTDYISSQYSYGSTEQIEKTVLSRIDLVSKFDSLCEDDGLMEVYYIIFDAGNGYSMLVSNDVELFSYLDHDVPEDIEDVLSIVCGTISDDNDISTIITEALFVHPKTKGFKVPDSDFFMYHEEQPSYSEFEEYIGTFFSCTKSLKTNSLWFDFFKAVNKLVVRNKQFNLGHNNEVIDDNEFILNQSEFCENIPDVVRLEYRNGNSNKFYNLEINNCAVLIEYGAIGKSLTTDEKDFDTYEEAKKFLDKKATSKVKSGYKPV